MCTENNELKNSGLNRKGETDLLKSCVSDVVIDEQNSRDDSKNLVKQIYFGYGVLRLAGVLNQQRDQSHVRVQSVETLGADQSRRIVLKKKIGKTL